MSLLTEISAAAVDSSTDLETLLRKCRVLSARLKNEDFTKWVQSELDGYPESAELPSYRRLHTQAFGHFLGPFGARIENAPIPDSCVPKKLQAILTRASFSQGVGAIIQCIKNCESGHIRLGWPADANRLFGHEIYQGYVLGQGWQIVPESFLVSILSTIRNRILSFVLELESENPDAGESFNPSTETLREKVEQIFHTHIYGNVGNVAAGHSISQTSTVTVRQGDFRSLENYLRQQGVTPSDISDLQKALHEEPEKSHTGYGKAVSRWMGKMVAKSAEGSWKVATTVASDILSQALKAYYGVP